MLTYCIELYKVFFSKCTQRNVYITLFLTLIDALFILHTKTSFSLSQLLWKAIVCLQIGAHCISNSRHMYNPCHTYVCIRRRLIQLSRLCQHHKLANWRIARVRRAKAFSIPHSNPVRHDCFAQFTRQTVAAPRNVYGASDQSICVFGRANCAHESKFALHYMNGVYSKGTMRLKDIVGVIITLI